MVNNRPLVIEATDNVRISDCELLNQIEKPHLMEIIPSLTLDSL